MHHKASLIVQPGDSFFPIVHAIDRAERTINLTIFRMDDPIIHKALVEAQKRRVRIRLLISSSARGWEEKNQKLLKDAKKEGIATKEPSADSKSARYHYKVMTVDDSYAMIFTFNPTRENLHYTRDFGVELYDPAIAGEINRLFDADWDDIEFTPDPESPLLISPFNSRQKMTDLLSSAETSIHIIDAKLEDPAIIKLLVEKAKSGVEVRVLGDAKDGVKLPAEIEWRTVPRFKLHAKCTIVDGQRAVLGSMNLRTQSMDRRREVCIRLEDEDIVRRLSAVFISDWEHKPPASSTAATQLGGIFEEEPIAPTLQAGTGLVLISRRDALVRHPLKHEATTIGRADENEIVVLDLRASRHHARINVDKKTCSITDLGSANGTFVNGERIEGTHKIKPGDVIDIAGADEFRLIEL